ncbi:MAG: sulfatase [Candidatus Sumerlaeia bacterium]|nr:sulfatase [Candidatus Sumerlaeia bacterium]
MNRSVDRRNFLRDLTAGTAALTWPSIGTAFGATQSGKSDKPLNVLFLFADQMHAFAMGCMGNPEIRTPNLDRLAAEGTLLRNTYSCAPVCTPFRAALLTGLYGSQTGILTNAMPLPAGEPTIADCFNAGGYRTSYIGKWHLGGAGNKAVPPQLRGGFQEFIGYQCYNDFINNVCFYDEEGREHVFHKHRTDVTTDLAISRLERLAGKPFLLMVSYQNPHYPLQPSPEFEAMYRDTKITRRPNCRDIDPYTPTASPPAPTPPEKDPIFQKYGNNLDLYLRLYYAMVTQLDANIGRLMAALDRLGLRDNTVVIFTSDHGDMQGSHGAKNKSLPWEESTRIPGIVRDPLGVRGQVCDRLISSVDFLPTCLAYAGLPPKRTAAGLDFSPLTRSRQLPVADRPIFSEMNNWCMVRQGRYKLVCERPSLAPKNLFDLEADPYEMNDLVADAAHAATRDKLHETLRAWNSRVTARNVTRPEKKDKARKKKQVA